ncbi:MAG: DNA topoisomerase IV [Pseudomonadota bacterium]
MPRKYSLVSLAVLAATAGTVQAGDVSFSGFLTVAGGMVDDESEQVVYAGYSEEDITFDADTVFGLQVSSAVTDKLTITGQLVARGDNDYDLDAEWAYVSYAFSDNFTGRMGRLRTPLYLYSDYVDVGYAYGWLRAPAEVYYLPFNNVQGIDFVWNYSVGSFDGSAQWYFGALTDTFFNADTQSTLDARLRNQTGLALSIGNDWLTLRAAYHKVDLTITGLEGLVLDDQGIPQIPDTMADFIIALSAAPGGIGQPAVDALQVEEDSVTFKQIGFTVDTGTFVAAGESVEFEVDDSPFSVDKRAYLMVGFRAGDFLFHVTKAEVEDEAAPLEESLHPALAGYGSLMQGIANKLVSEYETLSVGVRWDFTSSAAFKLQVDDLTDNKVESPIDVDGDQRVVAFGISTVF